MFYLLTYFCFTFVELDFLWLPIVPYVLKTTVILVGLTVPGVYFYIIYLVKRKKIGSTLKNYN